MVQAPACSLQHHGSAAATWQVLELSRSLAGEPAQAGRAPGCCAQHGTLAAGRRQLPRTLPALSAVCSYVASLDLSSLQQRGRGVDRSEWLRAGCRPTRRVGNGGKQLRRHCQHRRRRSQQDRLPTLDAFVAQGAGADCAALAIPSADSRCSTWYSASQIQVADDGSTGRTGGGRNSGRQQVHAPFLFCITLRLLR